MYVFKDQFNITVVLLEWWMRLKETEFWKKIYERTPDNYYLEQEIEQKNIDHNMELAMEASPESFGTVIMLYINCKVSSL